MASKSRGVTLTGPRANTLIRNRQSPQARRDCLLLGGVLHRAASTTAKAPLPSLRSRPCRITPTASARIRCPFASLSLTGRGINAGSAPKAVGGVAALAARRMLRRVAARAGWGRSLSANSGLGLASSFGQERDMPTWCACVAEVEVDRRTAVVTVQKLWLDIYAGTGIDPDLARATGPAVQRVDLAGLSIVARSRRTSSGTSHRQPEYVRSDPNRKSDVWRDDELAG